MKKENALVSAIVMLGLGILIVSLLVYESLAVSDYEKAMAITCISMSVVAAYAYYLLYKELKKFDDENY